MKKLLSAVFATAFLVSGLAFAQRTTVSISGTVTDPSGGVVPAAQVTAIETSTGATSTAKTSTDGFYVFANLPPGIYQLSVKHPGFEAYARGGIILQVDQPVTVNVALKVGKETQSVTVSGAAPQVNTRTGQLSSVVTGSMMVDLPLNGRNVMELMELSPDVNTMVPSMYNQIAIRPEADATFYSASGGRGNSTGFYLDGGVNEDQYDQVANVYPQPDAIQEFSYVSNNYSAKYGGRGGGIVNAVTRSGTNQFHGDAFEFVRNGDFNARNFFASNQDSLKRNQYGFTLGGPVQKDKTFFFVSWQGTKQREAPTENVAVTATQAERTGDFSAVPQQLVNPATGAPFPGNQISPSLFDPVATKVLALVPVGAPQTGIAFYGTRTAMNDDQWLGRFDRNFGNKLHFTARYLYDYLSEPAIVNTSNLLTGADDDRWKSQNIVLSGDVLLRPNLITSLTATYDRVTPLFEVPSGFPNWTQLGVNVPFLGTGPSCPAFSIGGYFGGPNCLYYRYPSAEYEVDNNWTYIRGGHTLEFGEDYTIHDRTTEDQNYLAQGNFTFNGQISGNDLLDFMLGKPDSFSQDDNTENNMQNSVPALYATDTWKIGRRLTLDLGVRWSPWIALSETTGNKINIFSDTGYKAGVTSKRFPLAPPGLLFPGDPGVPSTAAHDSWAVFLPRLGLAYDPFGNDKTAIRAGFGMYRDEMFTNGFNGPAYSFPFSPSSFIEFPVSLDNPYATPGFPDPFTSHVNFLTQPWSSVEPFFLYADDPNFTGATIQQWNFTIEHQLTSSLMIRTSYEGSATYHLFDTIEVNPATYIPGQSTLENVQSRRPMPQFSNVALAEAVGTANYNALDITVVKRLSHGLSLTGGFRWAKSLDEESASEGDEFEIADPFCIMCSYGPSDFDVGKQLILSALYALPTVQSLGFVGRQVLGGWHLNNIVTVRSGYPYSVLSGINNSLNGSECGGGCERADIIGNPHLPSNRPLGERLSEWFNPAAFTVNAVGTYGNVGRGTMVGPSYGDYDLALVRSFPIRRGPFKETQHIDFRAEFFNIFNRANFSNPDSTVTDGPTFGTILSASDPRILQFALKYVF
jgi:hypothetical protein